MPKSNWVRLKEKEKSYDFLKNLLELFYLAEI